MALQQFNAEGGLSVGNSLASVSIIAADGNISTTANITGNYVLGNGSQLAGLPEGYSNTKVGSYLEIYSGNIEFGNLIGNTSFGDKKIKMSQGSLPEMGVLVDYQGITISTGTPLAPQHGQFGIYATGNVTSTGNVAAANLLTDNLLYANGDPWDFNIAGGYSNANVANYLPTYSGNIGDGLTVSSANANVNGNINVAGHANITGELTVGTDINITPTNTDITAVNGGLLSLLSLDITNSSEAAIRTYVDTANSANNRVYIYVSDEGNSAIGQWDFDPTGTLTSTGNIAANYFSGNGRFLTGLPEAYSNANVANYLPTYTGNLVSLTGNVTTTANLSSEYVLGNTGIVTGRITLEGNVNVINANNKMVFDDADSTLQVFSPTWSSTSQPNNPGVGINSIAVSGATGGYMAAANSVNGNLVMWSTVDEGLSWQLYTQAGNDDIYATTIIGNPYVAGANGNVYSVSLGVDDHISNVAFEAQLGTSAYRAGIDRYAGFDNRVAFAGDNGTFAWRIPGFGTWSNGNIGTNNIRAFWFNNNYWVAAGEGNVLHYLSDGDTPDPVNWVTESSPWNANINALAEANDLNRLVALADNGEIWTVGYYDTPSANNWTRVATLPNSLLSGVWDNNANQMIVGSDAGVTYLSNDLINWRVSRISRQNTTRVTCVSYNSDDDRFLAGTNQGFIFYVAPNAATALGTVRTDSLSTFDISVGRNSSLGNAVAQQFYTDGNLRANAIYSDNLLMANGAAWDFGGDYSNANVANYLPTYTGDFNNIGNVTGGNITLTGNIAATVNGFSIGYRDIPQLSLTANTTAPAGIGGQHYYANNAGNITLTIPTNASEPFAIGTSVLVVARNSNVLLSRSSGVTLYLAGNGINSDRTVTANGMGSLLKLDSDTWVVAGAGVV